MPVREYRIFLLFAVVLYFATEAFGESEDKETRLFDQEAEDVFQRGIERYVKGHFQRARLEFQEVLEKLPINQKSSAAKLMLAKTLYKLSDYELAISVAEELKSEFPSSRYLWDADFAAGDSYFRQGRFVEAVFKYALVLVGTQETDLKLKAAERLSVVGLKNLSKSEIEDIKEKFDPGVVEEGLLLGEARWVFRWGYSQLAAEKVDSYIRNFPDGLFLKEAIALREEIEVGVQVSYRTSWSSDKIGVICPLSGEGRIYGEDLRDGAKLALEHSSLPRRGAIQLIVEDSRSDPITAVKVVQKLIEKDRVLAIVGPLYSSTTIGAAAVANSESVPLIAPTASEGPIASIGPYVFQINSTPEVQGKRMAEYAVGTLNLETFALIASMDMYGQEMSKSFRSRVEELGGRVLEEERYFPGTKDFKEQLERIRNAGLLLQDILLAADTSMVDTPAFEEDLPEEKELQPVGTIDGVLIAGASDDVILIAPQIALKRIETQLLGGSQWNSQDIIRMSGNYVEGALFVSGYFEDLGSPAINRFVRSFRRKFGRSPSTAAAFGYDAMSLVLKELIIGHRTRENLKNTLQKVRNFEGVSGRISFGSQSHQNENVYLLKIEKKRIVSLGKL